MRNLIKYILPVLIATFIVAGLVWASFPTSLDSLLTVSTGDVIQATAWNDKVNAINALETKVGIDSSADTSSLDYKVNHIVYKWELYDTDTLRPTSTAIGIIVSASSTFIGTITSGGGFIGNLTGRADTATALASNPTDCSGGQYANAIDASGNLTCAAVVAAGGSNWQVIGNALRPTSTIGIIVNASSTFSATTTFDGKSTFTATTTFQSATSTFDRPPKIDESSANATASDYYSVTTKGYVDALSIDFSPREARNTNQTYRATSSAGFVVYNEYLDSSTGNAGIMTVYASDDGISTTTMGQAWIAYPNSRGDTLTIPVAENQLWMATTTYKVGASTLTNLFWIPLIIQ